MARKSQKLPAAGDIHRPGTLNIRKVPGDLLVRLKVRAAEKQMPLREHVIQVLTEAAQ